jgi:hypothetical protein
VCETVSAGEKFEGAMRSRLQHSFKKGVCSCRRVTLETRLRNSSDHQRDDVGVGRLDANTVASWLIGGAILQPHAQPPLGPTPSHQVLHRLPYCRAIWTSSTNSMRSTLHAIEPENPSKWPTALPISPPTRGARIQICTAPDQAATPIT